MKRFSRLALPLSLGIFALSGYIPPQDRRYVDYFLKLQSAELFRTRSFLLNASSAYVSQKKLERIEMRFSYYKLCDVNITRKLITSVAKELIEKINSDSFLREKALLPEPFTLQQLSLEICMDNVMSANIDQASVRRVRLEKGVITYEFFKGSAIFHSSPAEICKETYQFALMLLDEPTECEECPSPIQDIPHPSDQQNQHNEQKKENSFTPQRAIFDPDITVLNDRLGAYPELKEEVIESIQEVNAYQEILPQADHNESQDYIKKIAIEVNAIFPGLIQPLAQHGHTPHMNDTWNDNTLGMKSSSSKIHQHLWSIGNGIANAHIAMCEEAVLPRVQSDTFTDNALTKVHKNNWQDGLSSSKKIDIATENFQENQLRATNYFSKESTYENSLETCGVDSNSKLLSQSAAIHQMCEHERMKPNSYQATIWDEHASDVSPNIFVAKHDKNIYSANNLEKEAVTSIPQSTARTHIIAYEKVDSGLPHEDSGREACQKVQTKLRLFALKSGFQEHNDYAEAIQDDAYYIADAGKTEESIDQRDWNAEKQKSASTLLRDSYEFQSNEEISSEQDEKIKNSVDGDTSDGTIPDFQSADNKQIQITEEQSHDATTITPNTVVTWLKNQFQKIFPANSQLVDDIHHVDGENEIKLDTPAVEVMHSVDSLKDIETYDSAAKDVPTPKEIIKEFVHSDIDEEVRLPSEHDPESEPHPLLGTYVDQAGKEEKDEQSVISQVAISSESDREQIVSSDNSFFSWIFGNTAKEAGALLTKDAEQTVSTIDHKVDDISCLDRGAAYTENSLQTVSQEKTTSLSVIHEGVDKTEKEQIENPSKDNLSEENFNTVYHDASENSSLVDMYPVENSSEQSQQEIAEKTSFLQHLFAFLWTANKEVDSGVSQQVAANPQVPDEYTTPLTEQIKNTLEDNENDDLSETHRYLISEASSLTDDGAFISQGDIETEQIHQNVEPIVCQEEAIEHVTDIAKDEERETKSIFSWLFTSKKESCPLIHHVDDSYTSQNLLEQQLAEEEAVHDTRHAQEQNENDQYTLVADTTSTEASITNQLSDSHEMSPQGEEDAVKSFFVSLTQLMNNETEKSVEDERDLSNPRDAIDTDLAAVDLQEENVGNSENREIAIAFEGEKSSDDQEENGFLSTLLSWGSFFKEKAKNEKILVAEDETAVSVTHHKAVDDLFNEPESSKKVVAAHDEVEKDESEESLF